jgi:twinkle protein
MSALPKSNSVSLSPSACAFLETRGLDADLCERLGLKSLTGQSGAEWIAFPFERNGVRVNRKFRSVEGKRFNQDKGGEQILWRLDCITDAGLADQPLIITEGELDCCAAVQAGFWRSVAFAAGAPSENSSSEEQDLRASARYVSVQGPELKGLREIILAVDADARGIQLRSDLVALLGAARCKFVTYPSGCKDLNDVLRERGEDGVRAVINAARWVNVAGVFLPSELPELPPLKVWRPDVFSPIDCLIPICPGHLSVWTGLAGDGKSTLVNAVMWTLAEKYGLRIAAAPFEATPQREYFQDLVAYRSQRAIGDSYNPATDEDVAEARAFWDKHIVFLNPDGYDEKGQLIDATIDWFLDAADTAVQRHGCRVIVLDPWSQIDHEFGSSEREDLYVRRVLKGCKRFARERDVHFAIVAHPAKPKRNMDGSYPIPEGYDISGAAHWKNAPDLGVTVYRDPPLIEDENNPGEMIPDPKSTRVLVKAWKVKSHRMMNPTGEVYASFDRRTGRYYSAEHWENVTHPKRFPEPNQGRRDD